MAAGRKPRGRRKPDPAVPGAPGPAAAIPLRDVIAQLPGLTRDERLLLVRQAMLLIQGNYVHLSLKRRLHAADPLLRLQVLEQRLEGLSDEGMPDELEFHRDMVAIFSSLHDLHTMYMMPEPLCRLQAFLPFELGACRADARTRYVVTRLAARLAAGRFAPGVELLRWSGVPIERALECLVTYNSGASREACLARGVERLTVRPLAICPPPDEDWVDVRYRGLDGIERERRFEWQVMTIDAQAAESGQDTFPAAPGPEHPGGGIDLEHHLRRGARRLLFTTAPGGRRRAAGATTRLSRWPVESLLPEQFTAVRIATRHGSFGLIRIHSFEVADSALFRVEFLRLLEQLPTAGLILDLRGNPGGMLSAAEPLLQLLTPRPIEPERFQFLNTALNRKLCDRHPSFAPWRDSLLGASATAGTHSAAWPITTPDACNDLGQRYHGPTVLLVDACSYSSTDVFAAGFQDHEIGPVLGVAGRTGAGGSNAFSQEQLLQMLAPAPRGRRGSGTAQASSTSPYEELPKGAEMRVSLRRAVRVGRHAGTLLEDFGVTPDELHAVTLRDLLEDGADLLERAAAILSKLPALRFHIEVERVTAERTDLLAEVAGFDRIDVYAGERPLCSLEVAEGKNRLVVPGAEARAAGLMLRGYRADRLVAARRLDPASFAA